MQNQLGFFFNAWRPRLAFLYAGVQGPLPVFRLLVTRCIFQCSCVYLFQCFIIAKGPDARCMIIFVASALSVLDCASWSGLPLWLDFHCGCSPSPGTNLPGTDTSARVHAYVYTCLPTSGRSAEPRLLFGPQHPPSGRLLGSVCAFSFCSASMAPVSTFVLLRWPEGTSADHA